MRQYIFAAMIVVLAAGLASAASVTVTQIKASGSGGKVTVDPKLSDIAESISKQFRFSKYEFLSSKSSTVAKGSTSTWNLSTGNKLDITVSATETEGKSVRYTLDIEVYKQTPKGKESILKTTVKAPAGKTFLIGLGEVDGWTLILAIKVEE
jgi:opacity protein-like surface antigen